MSKYTKEWYLYVKFCDRRQVDEVPGRDKEFDIGVMRSYLEWRSKRNNIRSIAGIKSKLKHCGICYGFVLPTAKEDDDTLRRLQLHLVTKHIGKRQKRECKQRGESAEPKRSVALGKVAVGLLFSAYGATSMREFTKLDGATRQWLLSSICAHSGAMRHKLIRLLQGSETLRWSEIEQVFRLASDWHKMQRRGAFTIPFHKKPPFSSLQYNFYSGTGEITGQFTAADALQWFVETKKDDEELFAPAGRDHVTTRDEFQRWIRQSFRKMLTGHVDKPALESIVGSMTPHSWRAGLASDMEREGVKRRVIMKYGRWFDERAMEQYARDGLAQRLQHIRFNKVTKPQQIHFAAMTQKGEVGSTMKQDNNGKNLRIVKKRKRNNDQHNSKRKLRMQDRDRRQFFKFKKNSACQTKCRQPETQKNRISHHPPTGHHHHNYCGQQQVVNL